MSESIIPTIGDLLRNYITRQHIMRYVFASKYVRGKIVVDVACGTGYGSHYLAMQGARYVVAIDLDMRALSVAKKHYSASNLDYVCSDARSLPLRNNSIDVFVSFETIEHLDKPTLFLDEITYVLKPSGVLIISTPNKRWTRHPPYHLHEFYPNEFYELLEGYFVLVEKYAQYISYGQLLKDLYSRFRDKIRRSLHLGLMKLASSARRSKLLRLAMCIVFNFASSSILAYSMLTGRKGRLRSYDHKPIKVHNVIIKLLERYEDCKIVPFRSQRKPLRIMIAVCKGVARKSK